jgi:hypothetical protein
MMDPVAFVDELLTAVCGAHLTPGLTNGWVYFFGDDEAVKIGWTEQLETRMSRLRTGHPNAVLEAWFAGTPRVEARLHALLAPDRIRGEWFRRTPELEELMVVVQEHVEADDQELVDEERAE